MVGFRPAPCGPYFKGGKKLNKSDQRSLGHWKLYWNILSSPWLPNMEVLGVQGGEIRISSFFYPNTTVVFEKSKSSFSETKSKQVIDFIRDPSS